MDSPSPSLPVRRRFTLLDGMILVGSAAVGLAAIRGLSRETNWGDLASALIENFAWDLDLFDQFVPELMMVAMPLVVAMTLGVLALRLRKPRPRWRRLARQPGLVACLALLLAWAGAGAYTTAHVMSQAAFVVVKHGPFWQDPANWLEPFTLSGAPLSGFAVVVAWATQILVGRWRAEPTWPDRLGRLAGLGWIAIGLAGWFAIRELP
jgi:hypothetical protein